MACIPWFCGRFHQNTVTPSPRCAKPIIIPTGYEKIKNTTNVKNERNFVDALMCLYAPQQTINQTVENVSISPARANANNVASFVKMGWYVNAGVKVHHWPA